MRVRRSTGYGVEQLTPPTPTRAEAVHSGTRYDILRCHTGFEAGLALKNGADVRRPATLQMTMGAYGHMFPSEDHSTALKAIAKRLFTVTRADWLFLLSLVLYALTAVALFVGRNWAQCSFLLRGSMSSAFMCSIGCSLA
jgi:hypothetical protein